MLLREASRLCQTAKRSPSRRFALLSSFEPLHLKTYLQAHCAVRFPEGVPEVLTFGFDQLPLGFEKTETEFKNSPAALVLDWADIHPGLSWRSRGRFGEFASAEILERGAQLRARVETWIGRRAGLSLVALPPREWLPRVDSVPPLGFGEKAAAAGEAMWAVGRAAAASGARTFEIGPSALNYRDLLAAGHPLSLDSCETLAQRLVAVAYPSLERKKALVVDLDGTLWSGVIGEGGPESVLCRAEGAGYPFYVFQKFLVKLRSEGVLLAFCSKNNPDDVLPVFDSLEMPLKLSDFAAYRCNWDAKSGNLRAIAAELNIGIDSIVMVDDNKAELGELSQNLTGVTLLGIPGEGRDWPVLFSHLQHLFGSWRMSAEDRLRTESFTARDSSLAKAAGSGPGAAEYLRDLALKLTINRDAFGDPRSLELINKTNQFNLTGERITDEDWLTFARAQGAFCWSAKLSDRFGDFGTICVLCGRVEDGRLELRQFVLSCRAFGRQVETLLLGQIANWAGREVIQGPFRLTGKNEPARRFLMELGLRDPSGTWRLDLETVLTASRKAADQSQAVVADQMSPLNV